MTERETRTLPPQIEEIARRHKIAEASRSNWDSGPNSGLHVVMIAREAHKDRADLLSYIECLTARTLPPELLAIRERYTWRVEFQVPQGDGSVACKHMDAATFWAIIDRLAQVESRPSPGVQPNAGAIGNAGQPGGAAHAGRALLDADGRVLEKFQYIRRRYQDGCLRDDDTNWLMNTVGDLLNRLTAQQEKNP